MSSLRESKLIILLSKFSSSEIKIFYLLLNHSASSCSSSRKISWYGHMKAALCQRCRNSLYVATAQTILCKSATEHFTGPGIQYTRCLWRLLREYAQWRGKSLSGQIPQLVCKYPFWGLHICCMIDHKHREISPVDLGGSKSNVSFGMAYSISAQGPDIDSNPLLESSCSLEFSLTLSSMTPSFTLFREQFASLDKAWNG